MKNIVYFEPSDAEKFDKARFEKSLREYANVPSEAIAEATIMTFVHFSLS